LNSIAIQMNRTLACVNLGEHGAAVISDALSSHDDNEVTVLLLLLLPAEASQRRHPREGAGVEARGAAPRVPAAPVEDE
jgi:hypothetical protein